MTVFTVARDIPWNIPLSTALSPKHFFGRILDWLNKTYKCSFAPSEKEMLFGINGNAKARRTKLKLAFHEIYYICSIKFEEDSFSFQEFAWKINLKLKIEKLVS